VIKPDTDSCHFGCVQFCERPCAAWPQKQLYLDRCFPKFHTNEYDLVLPDLEEDVPTKRIKKEPVEDHQCYQEVMPRLLAHKQLVSRRYVSVPDFPASHAALKAAYGSENVRDNSTAAFISVFSSWKNEVIDLSCSTHRLMLPALLRLLTSNDCSVSDQALKQSIRTLTTYKKTYHLYALYSAMKALAAFHPKSSSAVNCHILDKLPEKRSDESESFRVFLVLDYIVSCIELELLHYPMVRHRIREVSKLLAVDSPLVRRLIHETENRCSDVKTVALLQRAVSAVGMSDNWLFIDRLVRKLYRLYRHIRHTSDRHQLLASIAKPQLRSKLAEHILCERCCSYVSRPSRQFLTRDSVCALSSLLPEWLDNSSIGTTSDQIEEYLSVVVTYVESNLHIHRGLLLFIVFIEHIFLDHRS